MGIWKFENSNSDYFFNLAHFPEFLTDSNPFKTCSKYVCFGPAAVKSNFCKDTISSLSVFLEKDVLHILNRTSVIYLVLLRNCTNAISIKPDYTI